jgi:NTP pyrophosphatase (non-canonical NTP hydrolase)
MDEVETKNLYSWAWRHWGPNSQIDMLIEEMAELTQALLKSRRNGVVFSFAVIEEFADVQICMEQIKGKIIELGSGLPLEKIRETKLERLKNSLIADCENEGLADPIMGLSR